MSDFLKENFKECLSEDPVHITLFSALKMFFEAPNLSSFDANEKYSLLNSMIKWSKYGDDIDLNMFLNKRAMELNKNDKIEIFRQYYVKYLNSLDRVMQDKQSSLYCEDCFSGVDEISNVYEYLSPKLLEYSSGKTCEHSKKIKISEPYIVDFRTFSGEKISVEIHPCDKKYILVFKSKFFSIPINSIIKISDLGDFIKSWFGQSLKAVVPNLVKGDKKALEFNIIKNKINNPTSYDLPNDNVLYNLESLSMSSDLLFSKLKQRCDSEVREMNTVEKIENVISEMLKRRNIELGVPEFMERYYPKTLPMELASVSLNDRFYNETIDEITKNAKIRDCDLSSL